MNSLITMRFPLFPWTRRRVLRFALFVGVTGMLAGQVRANEGVSADAIVIGQTLSLKEGRDPYGTAVMDGIRLKLDAVNRAGGVHGRKLVLRTLDDQGKAALAEDNARTLVERDKAFVLFGTLEGGPSTAVLKVARSLGVPLFGPMAGSPDFREVYDPLVVPVRAEHKDEFRKMMQHAKTSGFTRLAFFRADSPTGEKHVSNVRTLSRELGMSVVADLPFRGEVSDAALQAVAGRILDSRAQMVMNHGSPDVYVRLFQALQRLAPHVRVYAVNSGISQIVERLGPGAAGMVFATITPPPGSLKHPVIRTFRAEFDRRYPGGVATYASLEGYLTAWALTEALERTGPSLTRRRFIDGLRDAEIDLAGLVLRYTPQRRAGLSFVELATVDTDGRLRY